MATTDEENSIDKKYEGVSYRLRAGAPMPILGDGKFVTHTFMVEKNDVEIYACKVDLLGSEDFRGQGGEYMSASFSRLNVKDGGVFSGKIVHKPTYIEETDLSNG